MKIALVLNTSWNIFNFRLNLIKHLESQGYEFYFIAPEDEYTKKIQHKCTEYHPLIMQNTGSDPLQDLSLFKQLFNLYRKLQPDVILHYTIKVNIYGSLAARLLGIPMINNVSGLGTVFTHPNFSTRVAKILYKLAFRGKMHVFFQNEDDQQAFVEAINFPASYSVIPGSGIDTKKFKPADTPKNSVPVFLMVARLLVDKGVLEYLEAAKLVLSKGRQAIFQLAGDFDKNHLRGVDAELIEKYRYEGIIEYLGHISPVNDSIAAADWVVLPSYREGLPRTLLEAAAMGKPLIATDVPGCRHVVHHGENGLLCQPRDAEDLAKTFELALEFEKNDLEAYGAKSRSIAEEKFDDRLIFEAYSAKIKELLAK